jgi:hypothetical protein
MSPGVSATRWPPTGCTLTDIYGIGDIGAATIVAIVDRCAPISHTRALRSIQQPPRRWTPVPAMSSAIGTTAAATARSTRSSTWPPSPRSATVAKAVITTCANLAKAKAVVRRCARLKRQLSDVIYRRLLADAHRREAAREDNQERDLMSA